MQLIIENISRPLDLVMLNTEILAASIEGDNILSSSFIVQEQVPVYFKCFFSQP